jgi:hypothetical protein
MPTGQESRGGLGTVAGSLIVAATHRPYSIFGEHRTRFMCPSAETMKMISAGSTVSGLLRQACMAFPNAGAIAF